MVVEVAEGTVQVTGGTYNVRNALRTAGCCALSRLPEFGLSECYGERIFIELETSVRKLKASREGSK